MVTLDQFLNGDFGDGVGFTDETEASDYFNRTHSPCIPKEDAARRFYMWLGVLRGSLFNRWAKEVQALSLEESEKTLTYRAWARYGNFKYKSKE